jgi:hypothetical protein
MSFDAKERYRQLLADKSKLLHKVSMQHLASFLVRNTKEIRPYSLVLFNMMKGAVTRVGPEETPFPYRSKHWYFDITPQWPNPDETDSLIAWTRSFWKEVEPHTNGTAVNWLADDDGLDRIKVAYGPNYSRLAKLKHKYDPENFFRLNNNVLPNPNG